MSQRRLASVLAVLGVLTIGGCSAPCEESLGTYPPPVIVVTGAESIEVPHISWACGEFHSDSMDPPPSVTPDSEQRLQVEVTLESGTTVQARFGNQEVAVDPDPAEGANAWVFQVPAPSEPLIITLCSSDGRCAMYWVNTYAG
ncbi:MAG: hypothetical protein ACRDX9_11670 [Acidimicrobiia bacterium]